MNAAPPYKQPMRRRRSMRRGAAVVEGALVLTALMLIALGILDVGIAVMQYNSLSNSARRLARNAITHGSMASPEHNVWGPATFSGTAADGNEIAATVRPWLVVMNASNVELVVEWIDGGNEPDQRVRVTMRYAHRHFMPWLLGNGITPLEAVSTMRIAH